MSKSIMEERKVRMIEKPNATSIGNSKVAYSREGDADDTLVARDLFEKSKYPLFGVKGTPILKSIFFAMLHEMKAFRKQISSSLKYEKKDFINTLDNMTAEDELMMTTLCNGGEEESRSEFEFESVKVRFTQEGLYPRFELINLEVKDERKVVKTAIHLFTSDAFKLLKYLQKLYNFSDNVILIDGCTPIQKFDNDDFF